MTRTQERRHILSKVGTKQTNYNSTKGTAGYRVSVTTMVNNAQPPKPENYVQQ